MIETSIGPIEVCMSKRCDKCGMGRASGMSIRLTSDGTVGVFREQADEASKSLESYLRDFTRETSDCRRVRRGEVSIRVAIG